MVFYNPFATAIWVIEFRWTEIEQISDWQILSIWAQEKPGHICEPHSHTLSSWLFALTLTEQNPRKQINKTGTLYTGLLSLLEEEHYKENRECTFNPDPVWGESGLTVALPVINPLLAALDLKSLYRTLEYRMSLHTSVHTDTQSQTNAFKKTQRNTNNPPWNTSSLKYKYLIIISKSLFTRKR